MKAPAFILEVNTRVWLRRLGGGRPLPIDQVPEQVLDQWQGAGFDAVWLMGVWHPSDCGREIARAHEGLQAEYRKALPDLKVEDIAGSPYAVAAYSVRQDIGSGLLLKGFRRRLRDRGMRLILDFVPNHTATDHPWVLDHPEWYVQGSEEDLRNKPGSFFKVTTMEGERVIAHGRDPYFPPWSDTAQLDYRNLELQEELCGLVNHLGSICDGVRCDMAMLVLSEVFEQTWGSRPEHEFWPRAIAEARSVNPDFIFMAEVYWDKDKPLLEMGFDLTYDKVPLDRAVHGPQWDRALFDLPVEEHRRRVRFLENHDEPRINSEMETPKCLAAAGWLFSLPTTRLFYDGQMDGALVRLPVQLLRAPEEEPDRHTQEFYAKLMKELKSPIVREGEWVLLEPRTAWHGNDSHNRILGQGYALDGRFVRVFVNWAAHRSQCWVDLKLGDLHGKEVVLLDRVSGIQYIRDGIELMMRGLYLDVPPWCVHFFSCEVRARAEQPPADGEARLPDAEIFSARFKQE